MLQALTRVRVSLMHLDEHESSVEVTCQFSRDKMLWASRFPHSASMFSESKTGSEISVIEKVPDLTSLLLQSRCLSHALDFTSSRACLVTFTCHLEPEIFFTFLNFLPLSPSLLGFHTDDLHLLRPYSHPNDPPHKSETSSTWPSGLPTATSACSSS